MNETLPRRTLRHSLRQVLPILLLLSAGVAAFVLPLFFWAVLSECRGESRHSRAELDLKNIQSAIRLYQRKTGQLPMHSNGLQLLVDHGVLDELPLDPWNNPYQYTLRGAWVELRSLGSDGVGGGEGNERDIELTFPVSPPPEDSPRP
ncbi:type II secretion system protein GspG [Myxococcus sp. CA040A]|uniref:type II secretion system protein GspG n=1 Tax=Myxococcus sp. CA040A TaxID=2741738 RepID=UPI00157A5823|nr:type II secretion system protein GspG [Myxococcus sp. CA040A]NTX05574.1 type II secretion system protein GspG [Myxococcus sp. CA040A]